MRRFNGIDELRSAVGEHVGYSGWHTVTQQQINRFARTTGDYQWIHVDPERAAEGPFGKTLAHGFLTLSLVPMLLKQVYQVEGLTMAMNYGTDRLRFPSPVPVGSQIRCGAEILALDPGTLGFNLIVRATVEVDSSTKPACVIEINMVLVP